MTFQTFSPRRNPVTFLVEFIKGLKTQKLFLPPGQENDLLVLGTAGEVKATDSPAGNYSFTGNLTLDDVAATQGISFPNTTAVPRAFLTSSVFQLRHSPGSPQSIEWIDDTNLYVGTLKPTTIGGSRTWVLQDLAGNVPVVGDDAPAVASGSLGKVDLTAQTADIATTALSNTPPAGFYEVEVYILTTTADVTAGTQAVVIGWTDNVGATTSTVIAAHALNATGRSTGRALVRLASGNLTYAVTNTGGYGTAAYAAYLRVVALG